MWFYNLMLHASFKVQEVQYNMIKNEIIKWSVVSAMNMIWVVDQSDITGVTRAMRVQAMEASKKK